MRTEWILILWVTAAGPLVYANFHGDFALPDVSLGSDSAIVSKVEASQKRDGQANAPFGYNRQALPEIDASARPIFKVAPSDVVPAAVPTKDIKAEIKPTLKGIIQRTGVNYAVFLPAPPATQYLVAGRGDVVGSYRVIAVMSDSVSVVKVTGGSPEFLELQGAGELP